jgi:hypothetical protein
VGDARLHDDHRQRHHRRRAPRGDPEKYFTYLIMLGGCDISQVTLEGGRSDWMDILGRLEKLKEYGLETP